MGIFSAIAGLFGYHPEEDALRAARGQIDQGYNTASTAYDPYIKTGQNALTQYLDATGQGNSTKGLADFHNSPIYQILSNTLNMGDTGVLAHAAGSLNSGNTIKAVQDYNRQQADQSFGQYLNPLAATSNQGYDATGQQANLAVQKAGSDANITNQIGQVQGANSIWGGLDGLTSDLIKGAGYAAGGGLGRGIGAGIGGTVGNAVGGSNFLTGIGNTISAVPNFLSKFMTPGGGGSSYGNSPFGNNFGQRPSSGQFTF